MSNNKSFDAIKVILILVVLGVAAYILITNISNRSAGQGGQVYQLQSGTIAVNPIPLLPLILTPISTSASVSDGSSYSNNSTGVFVVTFKVTALGSDIYIPNGWIALQSAIGAPVPENDLLYSIQKDGATLTTSSSSTMTLYPSLYVSSPTPVSVTCGGSESYCYKIAKGTSEIFKVSVSLIHATSFTGNFRMMLTNFPYNTDGSGTFSNYTQVFTPSTSAYTTNYVDLK